MRRLAIAVVMVALGARGAVAGEPTAQADAGEAAKAANPANPADPAEATAIFDEARALAKAGRYDEACVRFARSYELDPALGTALNLADCLERQGQLRRAWELFDRVARESQNVQSRARLARQRADALAARLATLIVTLGDPSVPGVAIRLGDRTLPVAARIRELVEPGDLEVVATAPGRAAFRATVHAAAGATLAVDVPAFAALHHEPATTTRRRRSFVYLAGGLGGAGALGLVGSLALGLYARELNHDAQVRACAPRNLLDDAGYRLCTAQVDAAGRQADRATVAAVAGAVLFGAAAAVFFAAPRETVQIAPIATRHELGLGILGRF